MQFPSREVVEKVHREFPEGTRVELVRMDDAQAPPVGTQGWSEMLTMLEASWFPGTTAAV